jgi:hypothetical protein
LFNIIPWEPPVNEPRRANFLAKRLPLLFVINAVVAAVMQGAQEMETKSCPQNTMGNTYTMYIRQLATV